MVTVPSERVECKACGTTNVVVPPTLGQFTPPEGEPARVWFPDIPEGGRLAQANERGMFRCAHCGAENEASGLRLS